MNMDVLTIHKAMHKTAHRTVHKALRSFIALLILTSLTACTVTPAFQAAEPVEDCYLDTREVDLSYEWLDSGDHARVLNGMNNCSGRAEVCFAAYGLVVGGWTVGSALVSGSVYLVGNTLHWLEYQGRCSSSELRQGLSYLGKLPEKLNP